MTHQLGRAGGRTRVTAAAIASLAVAGLAAGTTYAQASAGPGSPVATGSPRASLGHQQRDSYVDVTDQGGRALDSSLKAAARIASRPVAQAFLAAQPDGL